MSQSLLYHAFGVRGGYDYEETLYQDGCIRFVLSVRADLLVCPNCGGKDINRKGRRYRELQPVPIGLKPVWLVTEIPKCRCGQCGKRFEVTPPPCPGLAQHEFHVRLEGGFLGMAQISNCLMVWANSS
jgi:transposase